MAGTLVPQGDPLVLSFRCLLSPRPPVCVGQARPGAPSTWTCPQGSGRNRCDVAAVWFPPRDESKDHILIGQRDWTGEMLSNARGMR